MIGNGMLAFDQSIRCEYVFCFVYVMFLYFVFYIKLKRNYHSKHVIKIIYDNTILRKFTKKSIVEEIHSFYCSSGDGQKCALQTSKFVLLQTSKVKFIVKGGTDLKRYFYIEDLRSQCW